MMDPINTITLDKVRFGAHFCVSRIALMNSTLELNEFAKDIIDLQLRGFLFGEKAGRYTFRCPANWIEAVKERWLPEWAKRRWPVKYHEEVLDMKVIYPELKISLPEYAHALVIKKVEHY